MIFDFSNNINLLTTEKFGFDEIDERSKAISKIIIKKFIIKTINKLSVSKFIC